MGILSCEEFYLQRISLVQASATDYREFFTLLWESHNSFLFKIAYSRLRNREDARDVCQDAFLRAMGYLQKDPGRVPLKVNFRAWLAVIVRNIIYDRFRRVLVRPATMSGDLLETVPVEEEAEEAPTSEEELAILRSCLELLTERARTMVTMCDLQGMAEKEVAERLKVQANAVYVALHRARKALRECVSMRQTVGKG